MLPSRSTTSGSLISSGVFKALRYMKLFQAPYAMMIAALMTRNFVRLIVVGSTLTDRARHKGQRLNKYSVCMSSVMYAAKSSSISARSSWQFLQMVDAISELSYWSEWRTDIGVHGRQQYNVAVVPTRFLEPCVYDTLLQLANWSWASPQEMQILSFYRQKTWDELMRMNHGHKLNYLFNVASSDTGHYENLVQFSEENQLMQLGCYLASKKMTPTV